jgi:hypothetical protein
LGFLFFGRVRANHLYRSDIGRTGGAAGLSAKVLAQFRWRSFPLWAIAAIPHAGEETSIICYQKYIPGSVNDP